MADRVVLGSVVVPRYRVLLSPSSVLIRHALKDLNSSGRPAFRRFFVCLTLMNQTLCQKEKGPANQKLR